MQNQNQTSHTAQSELFAEARKRRLTREALGEGGNPTSPMHISFVVAVVIALLGGGTALMDDQAGAATSNQIAKSASEYVMVKHDLPAAPQTTYNR